MPITHKFLARALVFSSLLFQCLDSYADEAHVFCIASNGSRRWLPNRQIKKTILLDSGVAFRINNYSPPLIVNGVWKSAQWDNRNINYFLIDGGRDHILKLKEDCKREMGSDYIFVHPYHDLIPYEDYHLFGYISENKSDEITTIYGNCARLHSSRPLQLQLRAQVSCMLAGLPSLQL